MATEDRTIKKMRLNISTSINEILLTPYSMFTQQIIINAVYAMYINARQHVGYYKAQDKSLRSYYQEISDE